MMHQDRWMSSSFPGASVRAGIYRVRRTLMTTYERCPHRSQKRRNLAGKQACRLRCALLPIIIDRKQPESGVASITCAPQTRSVRWQTYDARIDCRARLKYFPRYARQRTEKVL